MAPEQTLGAHGDARDIVRVGVGLGVIAHAWVSAVVGRPAVVERA
jgi:hypothetical protein